MTINLGKSIYCLRSKGLNIKTIIFFILLSYSNYLYAWDYSNFKKELISPIDESTARNTLIVGTSMTLILRAFFEDSFIDPVQSEITEVNRLGSYNRPIELMGRVIPNAAYFLGSYGHYYFSDDKNKKSLKNAEVMLKATAYAGLISTILKFTVREERPSGGPKTSFPSGHTTTAFAFASVVAERHAWYYGVPAYGLATLVGFQRLNGNKHYLHDVIMGATLGTAFGIGMNRLLDRDSESIGRFDLLPMSSKGLKFQYSYNF